jgi:hypothetical protein
MTNELATKQLCIYVRNGIEIWLDEEKAKEFGDDLNNESVGKFNMIEGRLINTADIVGIFTPQDLEELKRRKQGQWKCKHSNWQPKEITHCDCGQRHEDWTGSWDKTHHSNYYKKILRDLTSTASYDKVKLQ